jgi:hypothetical protein
VTTADACFDTSSSFSLINYPNPIIPVISANFDTLQSTAANTYQWYLNGNLIPGETNQEIVATQNGSYSVEISDLNGCNATSSPFLFASVGKQNEATFANVYLQPNPIVNSSSLIVHGSKSSSGTIKIFTTDGKNVFENVNAQIFKGKNKIELPFENLKQGVYLIVLEFENKTSVLKAIKI